MDPARVAGTLWDVLYYLAAAVNRFLRPGPFNITSHDLLQESTAESGSGGDGHIAGVCQEQSDEAALEPSAPLPAWAGEQPQNAANKAPEESDSAEDSAATFRSVTAVTGEQVGADEDGYEEEAEAGPAQEIGEAFRNLPSRVCEVSRQPHPPTCEEPLPEHNDEAFAHGNKMQGFLRVEKFLAAETEAACATSKMGVKLPEGESCAPRSPTDGDTEELQEGMEALALERARRLRDAAGDNDETGRETLGFSRDKERMGAPAEVGSGLGGSSLAGGEMKPESCAVRDQRSEEVTKYGEDPLVPKGNRGLNETRSASDLRTTTTMCSTEEMTLGSDSRRREAILDTGMPTACPEGHSDSKQDEFSNESRYDAESFTIISSPELGFSDRSFGESRTAAFEVEQAAAQEVLEMKSLEIPKSDSEEEPASFSGQPGEKTIPQSVDKPESQIEVSSFVLNFAPQRSRMAVKNPRVRPPKDRRSLLQRPSLPPGSSPPPQPPSKIPVGVHVLGGFRLGIQLPGLGAAFPVAKKLPKMEAELKAAPKADATKQAAAPPQPKWMPPRQAGFGNPFMSELKTKLKKATKN
ncbi:uncharacterized protein LOC109523971 isoform X2 [Hippocampus comes]|uniref:uncharacterized protein LOC109523971 isoform X2 n=1 Tax=Hippocampus comes TaxID=109280 RepID=UPI00094E0B94|nr:PREDICTED: uncharacterized protein LOC109523971 isoform X2 [Hippocampus comes]